MIQFKIFAEDKEKYNCSDSFFCYIPNFITKKEIDELIKWANSIDDFQYNPKYTNTGHSRMQKWFQKDNNFFCPKWKSRPNMWKSFTYDNKLLKLQDKVQNFLNFNDIISQLGVKIPLFNSCLINKYRDGNDYIRPHRDTDMSFGKEPTIVGLSIGQARNICFKRVKYNGCNSPLSKLDREKQNRTFSYNLESGSLFIMAGSSQKFFSHEIPKSDNSFQGCRYSFTFREFVG